MLLLGGILTEKGILPFFPTALLLVMAAGCGYWLNYMTATVKRWLASVPLYQYQRTINLSERYGSPVLLAGRFMGFIRTLLPLLAGVSGIRSCRFHLFNWCGAGLWVYGIMMMGRSLASTVIFRQNSSLELAVLLVSSLLLLLAGISGSVWVIWRRNRQKGKILPTTRVGK
ncbi:DedA family protein [Salmonella enterica]|nr:DedA family protein [Salmonella enterica]EEK4519660.1 DedA family protein [Salmonella enterica]EIP9519723.1 VTT domain-containing protein [Salmonella enterica]